MNCKLLFTVKIGLLVLFGTSGALAMDTPPQKNESESNSEGNNVLPADTFLTVLTHVLFQSQLRECEEIKEIKQYLRKRAEELHNLEALPDAQILKETAKVLQRSKISDLKLEAIYSFIRPNLKILAEFCETVMTNIDNCSSNQTLEKIRDGISGLISKLQKDIKKARNGNKCLECVSEHKAIAEHVFKLLNRAIQKNLAQSVDLNDKPERKVTKKIRSKKKKNKKKVILVQKAANDGAGQLPVRTLEPEFFEQESQIEKSEQTSVRLEPFIGQYQIIKNELVIPNMDEFFTAFEIRMQETEEDEKQEAINIEACLTAPAPIIGETKEVLEEEEDTTQYYEDLGKAKKILADEIKELRAYNIVLSEDEILTLAKLSKEQRRVKINAKIEPHMNSTTQYRPKYLGLGKNAVSDLKEIIDDRYIAWEKVENTLKNQFHAFKEGVQNNRVKFHFYLKVLSNGDREFVTQHAYRDLKRKAKNNPRIDYTLEERVFTTEIPHARGANQKEGNKMYPDCHRILLTKLESVGITVEALSQAQ